MLLVFVLLSSQSGFGAEIEVEILRVVDGDTIEVWHKDELLRVRLQGIDAPELDQPFGQEARLHLSKLVQGQMVSIIYESYDTYGRLLGKILVNGHDINLRMIKDGLAWWYRYYRQQQSSEDQVVYESTEAHSKNLKLGLWVSENPIEPYEWRKLRKNKMLRAKANFNIVQTSTTVTFLKLKSS